MDSIGTGLQLMLIGMLTVFVILLIVIFGSRLLIKLINRIAPEAAAKAAPAKTAEAPMDVLNAAVAQITGGKGHIVKVTRIN